jgi:hypothetical protein
LRRNRPLSPQQSSHQNQTSGTDQLNTRCTVLASQLPIRGIPDGHDAPTAAVDSGCLYSVLSQDLHSDETA